MNTKSTYRTIPPVFFFVGAKYLAMIILVILAAGTISCSGQSKSSSTTEINDDVELSPEIGQEKIREIDTSLNVGSGFPDVSSILVSADGTNHVDQHGASLHLPSDLLDDGEQVRLISTSIDADLYQELRDLFHIESPVYSLEVVGQGDVAGRVDLSFPVENSQARTLVIIDDRYLGFLDTAPENGCLTVPAHIGPSERDETYLPENREGSGTVRYVVLSPKKSSGLEQPVLNASVLQSPIGLHSLMFLARSWTSHYLVNALSSTSRLDCTFYEGNHLPRKVNCRRNSNDSIQVHWDEMNVQYTTGSADLLINNVEEAMQSYYEAGFVNARLVSGSPMYLVITKAVDSYYHPGSGILYLDLTTANNLASGVLDTTMLHELAHIVQHKKYRLVKDYYSPSRKWWLEVSAENMVFLVAEEGVNINLKEYGGKGFQEKPFQWNESLYIHAQLLRVSMCPNSSICPLSIDGFKQAINQGTYPFSDTAAQALLTADLSDYARYLLGETPGSRNPITLRGMQLGGIQGFGENLIVRSRGDKFSFEVFGDPSQINRSIGTGLIPDMVTVKAQIEKGGVYPFAVLNGMGSGMQGHLPATLTIYPGAPFYMKVGDQEAQYYDGSQQITVQPISEQMGIPGVRVVALGVEEGVSFQAMVSVIDLQGDWIITDSKLLSMKNTCEDLGVSLLMDPTEIQGQLSRHFASRGVYHVSMARGELGYLFEAAPGFTLTERRSFMTGQVKSIEVETIEHEVLHSGYIRLQPEEIEWQMDLVMELVVPEATVPATKVGGFMNGNRFAMATVFLLILPGGAMIVVSKGHPRRKIILAILVMAFVSMACVESLKWNVTARLNQIEYLLPYEVNPSETTDQPIFRLSGAPVKTVLALDLIEPEIKVDGEVIRPAEKKSCLMEVMTESVVEIYPDGFITGYDMLKEVEEKLTTWDDDDDDDW
jgi:hypothetical protein